jgi:hypothetical protein
VFESLQSAPQVKISPWMTRMFFGVWSLFGVLTTFLELRRHELHRPVLLCLEFLMFALSAAWLRDSWTGSWSKRFSLRLIIIMILFLALSAIRNSL